MRVAGKLSTKLCHLKCPYSSATGSPAAECMSVGFLFLCFRQPLSVDDPENQGMICGETQFELRRII